MRTITKKISVSFDVIVEFEVDESQYINPDTHTFCKALNNWSHLCMRLIEKETGTFLSEANIGEQIEEDIVNDNACSFFAYEAAKHTLKPLEKLGIHTEGEIEFEFNIKADNIVLR